MAQAGQGRRAQTSWQCLELEEFKALEVLWLCSMVTSGMGGEEEDRDAELHPHFCCHQCWGGRGTGAVPGATKGRSCPSARIQS